MEQDTGNTEWNKMFDEFKYFILTRTEVVGVTEEMSLQIKGYVICGMVNSEVDRTIVLNKQKVISAVKSGSIEIIRSIPDWVTQDVI